jgi:hypothetical protein
MQIAVSPAILKNAIADLEKLDCHLWAFGWPDAFAQHKADAGEVLKRPWLYKPRRQAVRLEKNRDKPPRLQRRPKSSRD